MTIPGEVTISPSLEIVAELALHNSIAKQPASLCLI
jgi:hypothetical protein